MTAMTAATCPPPDQLAGYVQGRLDPSSHDAIDGHLDTCAACQQPVGELDHDSCPALAVGAAAPAAEEPDPTFRRLVECVKGFGAPRDEVRGEVLNGYELLE